MNDQTLSQELEQLATAGSLLSAVIGHFDENELVRDISFEFFRFDIPIAVVMTAGTPIGYLTHDTMLDVLLGSVDDSVTCGQASQPLQPAFVISPTMTFFSILETAEKLNAEMFVVASGDEVLGSLSRENLLVPRGIFLLRELARELEQAALELCTFYPKSFLTLSEGRQQKAKEVFRTTRRARWHKLMDGTVPWGKRPDSDSILRELVQCTTFCDKKTMLLISELGLTTDRRITERTFDFFERIRNYFDHAQAAFTRDYAAAEAFESANHEKITPDDRMPYLISTSVQEALSIESLADLARAVRECKDLIADIRAAL